MNSDVSVEYGVKRGSVVAAASGVHRSPAGSSEVEVRSTNRKIETAKAIQIVSTITSIWQNAGVDKRQILPRYRRAELMSQCFPFPI